MKTKIVRMNKNFYFQKKILEMAILRNYYLAE